MEKVPLDSAVIPRAGNKWLMIELVINPNQSPTIVHLNLEILSFRSGLSCVPEPWNGVQWWQKHRQDLENESDRMFYLLQRNTSAWLRMLNFHSESWNSNSGLSLENLTWFLFLKINIFLGNCVTSLMKYNSTIKLLHHSSQLFIKRPYAQNGLSQVAQW